MFEEREKLFEAIPLRNCLRNIQLELIDIVEKEKDSLNVETINKYQGWIENIEKALVNSTNNKDEHPWS